jgi:uncharacterized protein (TIGR03085 family)
MSLLARPERSQLCDLLDELGPAEPTLCEGWRTRDLAAHLVLRESRPDATPGILVPPLAPWTRRVQDTLASGDYGQLVARLRHGPPRLSPFRPARIDEAANAVELFVHHEDVRRAQAGWVPRALSADVEDVLWRRARSVGRLRWWRVRCGVTLVRDSGERAVVRRAPAGAPTAELGGPAAELLMYVFGRRDHALVDRGGDVESYADGRV